MDGYRLFTLNLLDAVLSACGLTGQQAGFTLKDTDITEFALCTLGKNAANNYINLSGIPYAPNQQVIHTLAGIHSELVYSPIQLHFITSSDLPLISRRR